MVSASAFSEIRMLRFTIFRMIYFCAKKSMQIDKHKRMCGYQKRISAYPHETAYEEATWPALLRIYLCCKSGDKGQKVCFSLLGVVRMLLTSGILGLVVLIVVVK